MLLRQLLYPVFAALGASHVLNGLYAFPQQNPVDYNCFKILIFSGNHHLDHDQVILIDVWAYRFSPLQKRWREGVLACFSSKNWCDCTILFDTILVKMVWYKSK